MNCLQCGKELSKGQTKFCSNHCAAVYNNARRTTTTKGKTKILTCVKCGAQFEGSIHTAVKTCLCGVCNPKGKHGPTYGSRKNRVIEFGEKPKRNIDTLLKGETTELLTLIRGRQLGINVSIPYSHFSRYDQIWDINGHLVKIQIKSARYTARQTIELTLKTTHLVANGVKIDKYHPDEVDAFITEHNGTFYFIPIEATKGSGNFVIRLVKEDGRIYPNALIHWAEDFELEAQLKRLYGYEAK